MGCRGNVIVKQMDGDKIYLYTHWAGSELKNIVKKALKRGKPRWDDESYLTRIIFSEMIKDEITGETGYGIATYEVDSDGYEVKIDIKKQTANGISFQDFIKV